MNDPETDCISTQEYYAIRGRQCERHPGRGTTIAIMCSVLAACCLWLGAGVFIGWLVWGAG